MHTYTSSKKFQTEALAIQDVRTKIKELRLQHPKLQVHSERYTVHLTPENKMVTSWELQVEHE